MKYTLDQHQRLDAVIGNVDLSDADSPEFELDPVDLSDDFPTGTILVTKRRVAGRNVTVGHIAPDGTFTEPGEPEPVAKDVKAKHLRVGYRVWAEGAPEPSRIHLVEQGDGQVIVGVDWGQIRYDRDEIIPTVAEILHPRIVDEEGTEIGLATMVSDGDGEAGEVIGFREPDESHWGVLVKWPEFTGPQLYYALPRDQSEEPLVIDDLTAKS